ncbi:uncharacterized protein LOC110337369 [Mus pahari]|uniref:uncharacterized protein LOC110337369 n=1 Tax=Mus pahari TaxID=10093 RepID=UPI000A304925|nr:uncharacterized protein LOC110337369 [Mus pahari]
MGNGEEMWAQQPPYTLIYRGRHLSLQSYLLQTSMRTSIQIPSTCVKSWVSMVCVHNPNKAATLHEAPGGHRLAEHGRGGLVPRVPRRAPERRPPGTDGPNPSEVSSTEIPVVSTLAPPRPSVTGRARDPPLDKAGRGRELQPNEAERRAVVPKTGLHPAQAADTPG